MDTAILGRMDGIHYLAGASVASLIITQVYWICGFLKMSLTGLSAQAPPDNAQQKVNVLVQGLVASTLIASFILLVQSWILTGGLWFVGNSNDTALVTESYFSTRIWGAPAALANMVFVGWLIGQQMTTSVLVVQVLLNLVNIAASLVLVYGLGMGVTGVALGTLFAEYAGAVASFYLVAKSLKGKDYQTKLPLVSELQVLAKLNSDIFIRNIALQVTLAFVTLIGVSFGSQAAAINAVILQFFALIALGLDGIANAVESMVGRAKGKHQFDGLIADVKAGLFWSSLVAIGYAVTFLVFGNDIVRLLTDIPAIHHAYEDYFWIVVALPLIAHWCFLFDGIYVGLTASAAMRNSMLISSLLGFFPIYWLFADSFENMALWFAMLSFLAWRGILLAEHFVRHVRRYPNTQLFG